VEYNKDNKKSKLPTSIRFNEAQLSIALSKSGKKGKQQLVDFLIDRYVNGENPIIERQPDYSNNLAQQKSWTGAAQFNQPKQVEINQPPLTQTREQFYIERIRYADNKKELDGINKEAQNDSLLNFFPKRNISEYYQKRLIELGYIYNDIKD
jgi:hypothetical protein